MIAQLGPVTVEAVRKHLKISVVSTYYQVLLSLGEPSKAVQLVEQAYEQVGSPEEVYSGLAEAAMNSYRVSHGMFADFVFVDRELAEKVYASFGDQTLGLTKYFLNARRPSKTSLICDVLGCSSGVPTRTEAAPSVVVQVKAPAPVSSAETEAPKPPLQTDPVLKQPEPSLPERLEPQKTHYLTDLDPKVIREMPRGSQTSKKEAQSFAKTDPDLLTPDQWRFAFRRLLQEIPSV
jgi:hypothetical protein